MKALIESASLITFILAAQNPTLSAPHHHLGIPPGFSKATEGRVRAFNRQAESDGAYIWISPAVSQSLLTHRDPAVPHHVPMGARVRGPVVVAYEITSAGKVRNAVVISGPKMLLEAVLRSIYSSSFTPYLLNGEPITVATWDSIDLETK